MIDHLHIIAFTHRNSDVANIGKLHISPENQRERLDLLKATFHISELVFVSTCNRVEYQFISEADWHTAEIQRFFNLLYPQFDVDTCARFASEAEHFVGEKAVLHHVSVASSIDSLVIGEREIITQVREAYEQAKLNGLAGDFLRILTKHSIQTAKQVYTETKISEKAVSIVSIAFQMLKEINFSKDARVLVIGAGVTNTAMIRFLRDFGVSDFYIYNRSLHKAEMLAQEVGGKAYPLSKISEHQNGFDLLVSCTSSEQELVDKTLYYKLLNNETSKKIVIDLALPQDVSNDVLKLENTQAITLSHLQNIADSHLKSRASELKQVEQIIEKSMETFKQLSKERSIEIAMKEVPRSVKQIKETALNIVFKEEINQLDKNAQETLEKILQFMEKKYISVPMKMAKEIITNIPNS
jgi:glutamyl-tRNA reductase